MDQFPGTVLQLKKESAPGLESGGAVARPRRALGPVVPSYRDLLRQAVSAMRHDLRRTLLTMAGMAWGIATVVLLLAYGNGFARAITNIFESFGATAVGVFPGRTSQQAGGNKAGVQIRFTNDDMELLRNNVPLGPALFPHGGEAVERAEQQPLVQLPGHGPRSVHRGHLEPRRG